MPTPVNNLQSFVVSLSAETGDLEAGTAVTYFRLPFGFTLTELPRASVSTAPVGSVLTVDINIGATSPATILSTKLTIDASETPSVTAATPAVIPPVAMLVHTQPPAAQNSGASAPAQCRLYL